MGSDLSMNPPQPDQVIWVYSDTWIASYRLQTDRIYGYANDNWVLTHKMRSTEDGRNVARHIPGISVRLTDFDDFVFADEVPQDVLRPILSRHMNGGLEEPCGFMLHVNTEKIPCQRPKGHHHVGAAIDWADGHSPTPLPGDRPTMEMERVVTWRIKR